METETSSKGINPVEQGNIGNTIVKDAEYDNDSSEKEESP